MTDEKDAMATNKKIQESQQRLFTSELMEEEKQKCLRSWGVGDICWTQHGTETRFVPKSKGVGQEKESESEGEREGTRQ